MQFKVPYSPPGEVLRRIGRQELFDDVDRHRSESLTKSIRAVFQRVMKSRGIHSRKELATLLGTNEMKAKRLFYDESILKMRVSELDDFLDKVGTSVKQEMPSPDELYRSILSSSVYLARQVRWELSEPIPGSPPTEDEAILIQRVASHVERDKSLFREESQWEKWFRDRYFAVAKPGDKRWDIVVSACDWAIMMDELPNGVERHDTAEQYLCDAILQLPKIIDLLGIDTNPVQNELDTVFSFIRNVLETRSSSRSKEERK